MEQEALYTIGQVSKICDVSQRMLRYYEKVGLITPDHIAKPSHYRYYSVRTMQRVQVIRYLIDQGFRLEEISEALSGEDMDRMELEVPDMEYGLLVEGRAAQRHQNRAITMKYIPEERYFYYTRQRAPEEQDSEIRLEIEYFTMSKRDGHSMVDMGGAFHVKYDSVAERMEDRYCSMTLLQTMFPNSKSQNNTAHFGGFLAVAGYHLGAPRNVRDSYERMLLWAQQHRFTLRGDCYERHVLDVYSTAREENFVTELLLPVQEDTEGFERLERWKRES